MMEELIDQVLTKEKPLNLNVLQEIIVYKAYHIIVYGTPL
jgi:hypothetical protein